MAIAISLSLLAVVVLIVGLKNPWMNLLAWIATLSVHYELSPDFRLALSDLFVPSLALSVLAAVMGVRRVQSENRTSLPAMVLFFAVVFIGLGNTVALLKQGTISQWAWRNKDIGLLDLTVCFFAILQLVDTREKLRKAVSVFVLGGSILNVVALLGGLARYFFGISNIMMYSETTVRLAGFMVDPSAYGGFLLCVLLLQLAFLYGESNVLALPRWTQKLNAWLLGVACLMTISRSALSGLFVGMVLLVTFYRRKVTLRLIATCSLAVCLFGLLAYRYQLSSDVAEEVWGSIFRESTLMDRVDINTAAMDMLLKDPTNVLTGIGVGTFLAHADEKMDVPYIIHNDFVWLFVETGILGVCLFFAIAARSLWSCVQVARAGGPDSPIGAGLACGIVGTLVWMMGIEGLWHRHVWLLLGLSEVCHRICVVKKPSLLVSRSSGRLGGVVAPSTSGSL